IKPCIFRLNFRKFYSRFYGNQPVIASMDYFYRTVNLSQILVGWQIKTNKIFGGNPGQISVHGTFEAVNRRVENQKPWIVIGSQHGSKTCTDTPAVNNNSFLRNLLFYKIINKLNIIFQSVRSSFAGAFSKTSVIQHDDIIVQPCKINGEFSPTFDTFRISFEVKNNAFCVLRFEMKVADFDARFRLSVQFFNGELVVGKFKIRRKFFRMKEKFLLKKINNQS